MKFIVLTNAEYYSLNSIIKNGWDEGSFEGYDGVRKDVQHRALKKFSTPYKNFNELKKAVGKKINNY